MKKFSAPKMAKPHIPKQGSHRASKPRLRTRHMSTIGKSAFAGPSPEGALAFPPSPMGGGGAPAFAPPGGPGGPGAPPDAGAGALEGGGGPPMPGM